MFVSFHCINYSYLWPLLPSIIRGYSFRCEHKIFSANFKRGQRCHEAAPRLYCGAPSAHIGNLPLNWINKSYIIKKDESSIGAVNLCALENSGNRSFCKQRKTKIKIGRLWIFKKRCYLQKSVTYRKVFLTEKSYLQTYRLLIHRGAPLLKAIDIRIVNAILCLSKKGLKMNQNTKRINFRGVFFCALKIWFLAYPYIYT